jgi:diguanylate cyclase (GGDEF)-like protein
MRAPRIPEATTVGRIGPGAGSEPAPSPLRVVLVGRTGLESMLRTDASIELVRARTPMDAIGELADPLDDSSPVAATVVLGPGSVADGRVTALVEALRLVQPDVRVLGVGSVIAGLDECVPMGADAAAIGAALRGGPATGGGQSSPVSGAMPAAAGGPPGPGGAGAARGGAAGASAHPADERETEAPAPSADKSHGARADRLPEPSLGPGAMAAPGDDAAVLAAVLAGRDPAPVALGMIASRLGVPARVFSPTGEEPPGSVPLVHAGRTIGRLACPGAPAAEVEAQARWLAPWLVLWAQHEQLRRAAFTDELTGAWNRRYFLRYLPAALEQARAARHTVTLLYFDVDNFKRFNDAHGHGAGDEILVDTVRLMTACVRPSDKVCRIGGDEFGVIFHDPEGPRKPETGAQGPASIAGIIERFQRQIREHRFPRLSADAPATLTISGGMATFPWDGRTPEELIERADELARQSKTQGKNAVTFGPGAERACRGH